VIVLQPVDDFEAALGSEAENLFLLTAIAGPVEKAAAVRETALDISQNIAFLVPTLPQPTITPVFNPESTAEATPGS
jgi:hypothetical protein